MNTNELLSNEKELNNVKDILKDTLQADPRALARLDGMNLDMDAIKTALTFLYNNPKINEKERNELLTESWRINYREKPPEPEEFLTEKYLGPVAKTLYPRVKKVFLEFMNPGVPYRRCILYPFIGFGKSFCSTLITLYIATHLCLMRDPWKFFGLSQPMDSKVYIDKDSWKYMKDVKEGDVILGSDGSPQKVVETKIWEDDEVYEIELEDGSKVQAGINHLWVVNINGVEKEVNTKYILDNIEKEDIRIMRIVD